MRISHLFGCALLALSSASLQAATSDVQAKCEQQLNAQQGNLETGKLLGQMLGNEAQQRHRSGGGWLRTTERRRTGGQCQRHRTGRGDRRESQAVTQAKDAVLGLGKMFGK